MAKVSSLRKNPSSRTFRALSARIWGEMLKASVYYSLFHLFLKKN